jgi:small-conductance mechanosensitive channel
MSSSSSSTLDTHPEMANAGRQLFRLTIKIIFVIAATWIGLHVLQTYLEAYHDIDRVYYRVIASIAIIISTFIVIQLIRQLILKFTGQISPHLSSTISFFAIIVISLLAFIALMYQLNIDPQAILVGGGVTAVIIGIALSTIVGNILSGGLVLTAFPARIGDKVFIVNDNVHGKIEDVNLLYTKVKTDQRSEYFVPNNAIVQGIVRLVKEHQIKEDNNNLLPFSEGDRLELTSQTGKVVTGRVSTLTQKFVLLIEDADQNEILVSIDAILSGQYITIRRVIHKDYSVKTSDAQ